MVAARSDPDRLAEAGGNVTLSVPIVAPGDNSTIPTQSQAVPCARRNRDDVGRGLWKLELAQRIVTGCEHQQGGREVVG